MGIQDELNRQTVDACLSRLWANTVGIVNSIRTVGYDPQTKRQGDGETTGTGCAGRWGKHSFVLTAEHVIDEKAKPSDLRIFWRSTGNIDSRPASEVRRQDIEEAITISDPEAAIHRCHWEDLAVITMSPESAGTYAEFFDIENEWIDPPEGDFINCIGFPIDMGPVVEKNMIGDKEERIIALYPTVFSSPVLPMPEENDIKFLKNFNPNFHYLVRYPPADHGKHPLGISGGPTWWESKEKQVIWKPTFKFAGICSTEYKKGTLEKVIKPSSVRRFLGEVFGPAS